MGCILNKIDDDTEEYEHLCSLYNQSSDPGVYSDHYNEIMRHHREIQENERYRKKVQNLGVNHQRRMAELENDHQRRLARINGADS